MSTSKDVSVARILPLGGCMLIGALSAPYRHRRATFTFTEMGHGWPICYSVQEALRVVQFYRGDVEIPMDLRPFCDLPSDFDPKIQGGGRRFQEADLVLLEPNTPTFHIFSGIPITRSKVSTLILDPLAAIGKEFSDAAAAWFTHGLLGCDEKLQREAAAVLLPALEGRVENPALARDILLYTRSTNADRRTFTAAIAELKDAIGKPMGLVTFTYQYLPNGRGVSWPADFVENTLEAGARLGIPCFHPADLVRKFGANSAMENNFRFYKPEFEPIIGDGIIGFCNAVMNGTGVAMASSGATIDKAEEKPSRSMSRIYAETNSNVLSLADMSLPLGDWRVIRASLSEDSQATPIKEVIARKLIEDGSPSGNSHDIRAYITNTASARAFRVAFLACPDERQQVRIWLGTGMPAPGGDRVDVTFDLTSGSPVIASAYGKGWEVGEANSEDLGESWRLYWLVGESNSVVPELFVSVMTATASGALPAGDGRAGVWLGGLRVDALQEDWTLEDAPRMRHNPRDLADVVSDEILAFLLSELKAKGDLYQWYKTRYLPNNIGLSRIDREIASFVLRRFGATRKTLEVGAGVAQCSQLLALSGVHAIGVEASSAHMDMMKRLTRRLSSSFDPELLKRFTPVLGFYPDDVGSHIDEKTIVIVPSLGSTLTAEQEIKVFDALRPAAGVILGERMFFRVRDTAEERTEMISQIQKRGFGNPETIFAWDDWHFGFHPDRIIYLPKV